MSQHQAAFIDRVGDRIRIGPIDTPEVKPGEILVRAAALALNPVDYKIQDSGALIGKWPVVAGEDVAGEVVKVGEGVTRFSVGQRVIVHAQFLYTQQTRYSGFQELVLADQGTAAPLPDKISYEAGSVVPLCISTAAAALFQPNALGLDFRSLLSAPEEARGRNGGKTVLVWGASSSVGSSAVQLATLAGYDVVATASPQNFDFVRRLGARAVLDYRRPDIVAELVAQLKKAGEFVGVFDSIALRESQVASATVVKELGKASVATVLQPVEGLPAGVAVNFVIAPHVFHEHAAVGKKIWEDFLPSALESGRFKIAPPPKVVGKGLESLQASLDLLKVGVSATKLVVTL